VVISLQYLQEFRTPDSWFLLEIAQVSNTPKSQGYMPKIRGKLPFKVAQEKELPSAFLRYNTLMTPLFFLKATPEKNLPGS